MAEEVTRVPGPRTLGPLAQRPAWRALEAHYQKVRGLHLRTLFAEDPTRGERMTAEAAGIFLDYSKNRITDETLKLLCSWPRSPGLRERIDAMFRGDKINFTEKRAVLHVALRAPKGRIDCGGWRECGAGGPRRAGQDGGVLPIACAAANGRDTRASGFAT